MVAGNNDGPYKGSIFAAYALLEKLGCRWYFPRRMMSDEYAAFAARIGAAFPDKFISLSAYSLREVPPQGVSLPPNISVQIWPITRRRFRVWRGFFSWGKLLMANQIWNFRTCSFPIRSADFVGYNEKAVKWQVWTGSDRLVP